MVGAFILPAFKSYLSSCWLSREQEKEIWIVGDNSEKYI